MIPFTQSVLIWMERIIRIRVTLCRNSFVGRICGPMSLGLKPNPQCLKLRILICCLMLRRLIIPRSLLGLITLLLSLLVCSWLNMTQQKKFGITWRYCILSPILLNNISYNMICVLFNRMTRAFKISMSLCPICGTNWLLLKLKDFESYLAMREEQCLVQFLRALRSDFEGLRGTILHRSPLPSMDFVVHELIVEETRIKSHVDKDFKATSIPTPAPVVLAISSNHSRQTSSVAYDESAFCKQKNHWKAQCPLLVNKGKSGQPLLGQQNRSSQHKFQPPSSGTPPWTPRPPQFVAAALPLIDTKSIGHMPPSALDPKVF
ncbi:uncharacterized protein LOC111918967 [Lactuca sativa]|uniref:uncharacterized protein LOC111918967 n=1 Tax=Lactuca sativa TaxID=4236 RepID=UPI001C68D72D|nr:uncharacterized protein LOC111918967 [Lactuca sativa]